MQPRHHVRSACAFVALLALAAVFFGCGSSGDTGSTGGNCNVMAAPGSLDFAKACCSNADCKTMDCLTFMKGQFCSHTCSSDADCVNDKPNDGSAPKCGGMGVCKVGP